MCSPFSTFARFVLTNSKTPFTNQALVAILPANELEAYQWFLTTKLPGHPHFPYGIAVVPDAPVV